MPTGYTHQLRYRRINNDTIFQLQQKNGDEVLVVLIDKFTKDYTYVPIRFGYIINQEQILDRTFITIELQSYVTATNVSKFNAFLKEICSSIFIPMVSNDNLKTQYALYKQELDLKSFKYIMLNSDWFVTIEQLKKFKAFKKCIFYNFRIINRGKEIQASEGVYRLKSGKQYVLRLQYLNYTKKTHKILIKQTGNVQIVHTKYLNVDINSNKVDVLINICNEHQYISGIFLFCKTAIISDDLIKMFPKHSILKHLLIILILLIYSGINVILASYQFDQASNILKYVISYAPTFLNSIIFYILYLLNDKDNFLNT